MASFGLYFRGVSQEEFITIAEKLRVFSDVLSINSSYTQHNKTFKEETQQHGKIPIECRRYHRIWHVAV
jgi:hypothetical protein